MKNKYILVLLVLLLTQQSIAQKTLGTSFFGSMVGDVSVCENGAGYASASDVEALVTSILGKYGLRNGYIIMSCTKTDNCMAILDDKNRPYILFNPNFLKTVRSLNFSESNLPVQSNDWKTLTILAHEIGHHLNNHLINPRPDMTRIDMELEADETAGFIVYLLGGELNNAQSAYLDKSVSENTSYTHPGRAARLKSVAKGWEDAKKKYPKVPNTPIPVVSNVFRFIDPFYDNSNDWTLEYDADKKMTVENGKLRIKGISDKFAYYTVKNFDIDATKDFSVSVVSEWVEGINNNGYGVNFCSNNKTNSHNVFFITANGYYSIGKIINNGNWIDTKKWVLSSAINRDKTGKNILKINKIGNALYFYINNQLVDDIPFDSNFGNDFGVRVSWKQTIDFDNFEVTGEKGDPSKRIISNNNAFAFSDGFYSNENNWPLVRDEKKQLSLYNNKLRIKGITESFTDASINFDVDVYKDFKVSVDANWIEGENQYGYGIDFCKSDKSNSNIFSTNLFYVSPNGMYLIGDYDNAGVWTSKVKWTNSDYINLKNIDKNNLTIEKKGDSYLFYINGKLVETLSGIKMYGNKFGCRVTKSQTVDFDNFNLTGRKTDGGKQSYYDASNISFFEPFSDNSNNWPLVDDTYKKISIKNDKLSIKGINDQSIYAAIKNFDVKLSDDFNISVDANWIEGIDNYGYGINFCNNTTTVSSNRFYIANGSYTIGYFENNGTWNSLKSWTASSFIKKKNEGKNTLRIEKTGTMFKFYINNNLIETFTNIKTYGNQFGVEVNRNQTVEFDNFTINGTKK